MLVKRFANSLLQLIAIVALLPSKTNAQKILTSLAEYDELRNNSNGTINRVGNVDLISDNNGDTIGLCNMAMMMPFSFYPGPPVSLLSVIFLCTYLVYFFILTTNTQYHIAGYTPYTLPIHGCTRRKFSSSSSNTAFKHRRR